MEQPTEQGVKKNLRGKGGFGDNPQNRNNGGRVPNPMKAHILKRFNEMTDKQKDSFIKSIDAYKQITLAEGNPRQDNEHTGAGGKDLIPETLTTEDKQALLSLLGK